MSRKKKKKKRVLKKTVNGQLNVWGIYSIYKKELEKNWDKNVNNDDERQTSKQYESNFRNILGPRFEDKAFADCSYDDIIKILKEIKSTGYKNKGKQKYYSDSKMSTLLANLRAIDNIAVKKGIRRFSLFWGTASSLPNYDVLNNAIKLTSIKGQEKTEKEIVIENIKEERISLRKSLTPPEETKVFETVMIDPKQCGEFMGVALMFAFGLRNAEACGVQFGDIIPITGHEECYKLTIYKTATRNREITASVKTENAYRSIPVYGDYLLKFLNDRKDYIKSELNISDEDVNKLTIACVGKNFYVPCNTNDLTQAGKEVLNYAGVSAKKLAFIEINNSNLTPKEEEIFRKKLIEKEPTAYLLRRHFGTVLAILSLSLNEIQYLMGHDISDFDRNRYNFTNPDHLFKMKKKLDERTLFSSKNSVNDVVTLKSETHASLNSPYGKEIIIPKESKKRKVIIKVEAKTPNDNLNIHIETDRKIPLEIQDNPIVERYDSDKSEPLISIKTYHNVYKKVKASSKMKNRNRRIICLGKH